MSNAAANARDLPMTFRVRRDLNLFAALSAFIFAGLAYHLYSERALLQSGGPDLARTAALQKRLWDSERRTGDLERMIASLRGGSSRSTDGTNDAAQDLGSKPEAGS